MIMPANVDPSLPNQPNASSFASSSSSLTPLPPRKLSRLLHEAERPLYILDGHDCVGFANQCLIEVLKTTESQLVGLDCSRVLTSDDHLNPTLAGLLAIPERARTSRVSFDHLGMASSLSTTPWSSRLVIPLDSQVGNAGFLCLWLRSDDPLVVQASQQMEWLAQSNIRAALVNARRSHSRLDGLHSLIGSSPSAQLARRQAQAAIASSMPVCVYGPSGTGKATLIRAIYHQRRKRERRLMAGGRLLSVDCRLMDRSLMQETLELAIESDSSNRADSDNEPTALLLEGIDQLASDANQPLANFLANHPTTPVFATSRADNLFLLRPDPVWQEIVAHLHVMSIHLEPLSNRIEDIGPLAEAILEEIRTASSGQPRRFLSASALSCLQAYSWPNNFGELNQAIRDACQKATTSSIEPSHFSLAIRTFASHVFKAEPLSPVNLDQLLEEFERSVLQQAISAFPRNRAAAARHLGISRTRLLRRLAQFGLEASAQDTESNEPSPTDQETTLTQDSPIFEEIPEEPQS